MTTKEKIEVMQAYTRGEEIERLERLLRLEIKDKD